MRGWTYAALGLLAVGAMVGCSAEKSSSPKVSASTGAGQKTILLGASNIEPDDVTVTSTEVIEFNSTALDPLQVEFIKPANQAGKINCRVADPKSLKPGEKPWATFNQNGEGHFTAMIPPGRFPSTCTLAPGSYTFVVHNLNEGTRASEGRLGQEGNITVR